MNPAAADRASHLLHHLLNQSLSGLDFCILWQELAQAHSDLEAVDAWVRKFLETAELSALDRALAMLPEPPAEGPLPPLQDVIPTWYEGWEVTSRRIREITRVEFRCRSCGFEIDFSAEHPANTEMRLPMDALECPVCLTEC